MFVYTPTVMIGTKGLSAFGFSGQRRASHTIWRNLSKDGETHRQLRAERYPQKRKNLKALVTERLTKVVDFYLFLGTGVTPGSMLGNGSWIAQGTICDAWD